MGDNRHQVSREFGDGSSSQHHDTYDDVYRTVIPIDNNHYTMSDAGLGNYYPGEGSNNGTYTCSYDDPPRRVKPSRV